MTTAVRLMRPGLSTDLVNSASTHAQALSSDIRVLAINQV